MTGQITRDDAWRPIAPDRSWRRLGSDGPPPRALALSIGGKTVARVVDISGYLNAATDDRKAAYVVQYLIRGHWLNLEGEFGDPDSALADTEAFLLDIKRPGIEKAMGI